jgi:hypothetical protein
MQGVVDEVVSKAVRNFELKKYNVTLEGLSALSGYNDFFLDVPTNQHKFPEMIEESFKAITTKTAYNIFNFVEAESSLSRTKKLSLIMLRAFTVAHQDKFGELFPH